MSVHIEAFSHLNKRLPLSSGPLRHAVQDTYYLYHLSYHNEFQTVQVCKKFHPPSNFACHTTQWGHIVGRLGLASFRRRGFAGLVYQPLEAFRPTNPTGAIVRIHAVAVPFLRAWWCPASWIGFSEYPKNTQGECTGTPALVICILILNWIQEGFRQTSRFYITQCHYFRL